MDRWFPGVALATSLLVCTLHAQTNVLLVLADDMGVDRVGAYGEHPDPGHTPVIDGLAAGGVLFRNAWATPVCSPTRASLLTGRHPFRHGLGSALVPQSDTHQLWAGEVTLPRLLEPQVATLMVGKWHLALTQPGKLPGVGDALVHPLDCGFRTWAGSLSVLKPGWTGNGYYDWVKVVDGVPSGSRVYNTTATVDDALALLAATPEPWFLFLAFHAPHIPFHAPPPELHTFDLPHAVQSDFPLHGKAAIEAMDTELGRLLSSLDADVLENTLVIFAADNGTEKLATTPPFLPAHAKGTLYEGGLNVPLIVKGPGVAAGAECEALVSTTDLFATVADLFGVEHPTGVDSVSLVPYFSDPAQPSRRATVFSEWFDPPGYPPYIEHHRAARDERFKLMHHKGHAEVEELYDLLADPFEQQNLLLAPLAPEAAAAYAALSAVIRPEPERWNTAGLGVTGVHGEPRLTGEGDLQAGASIVLEIEQARPVAAATLLAGTEWIGQPWHGGVLGPLAVKAFPGLVTDGEGQLALSATWPANMPPGQQIILQAWLLDEAAPYGLAATNNLVITTPSN